MERLSDYVVEFKANRKFSVKSDGQYKYNSRDMSEYDMIDVLIEKTSSGTYERVTDQDAKEMSRLFSLCVLRTISGKEAQLMLQILRRYGYGSWFYNHDQHDIYIALLSSRTHFGKLYQLHYLCGKLLMVTEVSLPDARCDTYGKATLDNACNQIDQLLDE